jgi:hypothetical protein
MADSRKITPDFFADSELDPVDTATGSAGNLRSKTSASASATDASRSKNTQAGAGSAVAKKKAGFYLSADILNRFNLKFYELKLSGAPIENKSNLLELMLGFALDDMDKGEQSRILHKNNIA